MTRICYRTFRATDWSRYNSSELVIQMRIILGIVTMVHGCKSFKVLRIAGDRFDLRAILEEPQDAGCSRFNCINLRCGGWSRPTPEMAALGLSLNL